MHVPTFSNATSKQPWKTAESDLYSASWFCHCPPHWPSGAAENGPARMKVVAVVPRLEEWLTVPVLLINQRDPILLRYLSRGSVGRSGRCSFLPAGPHNLLQGHGGAEKERVTGKKRRRRDPLEEWRH